MRVVVDAGVLVSALITPSGVCGQVLDAALEDAFTLIVSPALLGELAEVLMREKFRRYLSQEEAVRAVALLARVAEIGLDAEPETALTRDPDDDYLVMLARTAGADVLVSGDPDLTALAGAQPPVVTPRQFLDRLAASSS